MSINKRQTVLITGSGGLVGSESVIFFCDKGFEVIGIDNDMRSYFFGKDASTESTVSSLEDKFDNFKNITADIRNEDDIEKIFKTHSFDLVIHTAAQPSHDWAAKEPLTDFTVNAHGTLILLEACRKHSPDAVFIFTSTNKVYGDNPNKLPLQELDTRYEISDDHKYKNGINEYMSTDHTKHSLFGASKVAADVLVQEYGNYFNMKTAVFRGGCLTGPNHKGAKLHGFLSYLVQCVATETPYVIIGHKGKQVRDNIHSYDLVNAFWHFFQNPRSGEVYNIGGGTYANVSMLEAIEKIERRLNKKAIISFEEEPRQGDHIWYVSDISKFMDHYPEWSITYTIDDIIKDICKLYK